MKSFLVPMIILSNLLISCGPVALIQNLKGHDEYGLQEYESAIGRYEMALKFRKHDPDLMYNVGNVYYRKRRYIEAQDQFRRALSNSNQELAVSVLFNLGNAFFNDLQFAKASLAYKEILRIDNSHQDAKHNLELSNLQLMRELRSRASDNLTDDSINDSSQKTEDSEVDTIPDIPSKFKESEISDQTVPELTEEQARNMLDAVGNMTETLRGHMQRILIDPEGPSARNW